MHTEIIIAGFGGQGILFAGELLSYTALVAAKETTWYPSYGPEMRGGTANCTVVVSDELIASPVVEHPNAVIALNIPSFTKYETLLQEGGYFVVNSSLIDMTPTREGIHSALVPATEIAEEIGDKRITNSVSIGALVALTKLFSFSDLEKGARALLAPKGEKLIALNLEALKRGFEAVNGQG